MLYDKEFDSKYEAGEYAQLVLQESGYATVVYSNVCTKGTIWIVEVWKV